MTEVSPDIALSTSFQTSALSDVVSSYRRAQTFLSSSHITTQDAFPEHWRHDEENGVSESNNNLNENAILGDDMPTLHQENYADPFWDEGTNLSCVPSVPSPVGNERTPLLTVPSQQMYKRFVNGKNHLLLRKTSTLSVASKQPKYYFEPGRSTYRQTLFNSTAILLGVGMLSEPSAFALAGWIPGFILIVFYGFITCYTAKILARIIREDPNLRTYADIALKAFGRRSRVFTGLLFFLELFSVCVILITLCGDSLHLVLPTFTSNQYKLMTIIALAPAMFLPLSILAYASLLGVLSTFSIMGCIMIDGLSKPDAPGSLWQPADTILYGTDARKIGVAFGLFMAGFGGHAVMPSLARDMQDPSQFDDVMNWAFVRVAIATFLYGVIGAAGYLMFGESVGEEISKNILEIPEYNQFLNNLTVWMLVFAPLTKYPLNMRPLSLTIEIWLGLDKPNPIQPYENGRPPSPSERSARALETSPRTSRHPVPLVIERILLVIFSIAVSILIPEFSTMMAFLGSFSAFIGFTIVIGLTASTVTTTGRLFVQGPCTADLKVMERRQMEELTFGLAERKVDEEGLEGVLNMEWEYYTEPVQVGVFAE
ncbi:hypothetical protein Clacol_002980 [Clathrus columnatus]|uniref:Amino acid transporter transmembrane domain-containing protein n=1 Tax=Clathrus columnatus TaxID=1419009 RepID=A0AAV5A271_9AGAM|nr:hypothetical protein Clacol_002980 [Clathrus columnatus]